MKIAFLIPIKIGKLDFNSKIYNLLNNFFVNKDDKYNYNFYLGFNHNDKCLEHKGIFDKFNSENFSVNIKEFSNNIKPGHLTKMWNELFYLSYKGNDYFYQLGDDILFDNYNFIDEYIKVLNNMNNIGVTGYLTKNGNNKILTQSFVSKKHFEIFGYYFPETIINWCCDNWINDVYKKFNLSKPLEKKIINSSDSERYIITIDEANYKIDLERGIKVLDLYIGNKNPNNIKNSSRNIFINNS